MFTVGALGTGHFSSFKAGFLIYALHLFSSIIAGLLTRPATVYSPDRKDCSEKKLPPAILEVFPKALKDSLLSMALICGNFIVFKVICSFLFLFSGKNILSIFLSGLLEVTGGVLSVPTDKTGLIMASFLLSFNGLCVHMQSMSFFSPLKLSLKKVLAGKIFSAFLSAFLMYLTLPENFLSGKNYPPMTFYVILIVLPLLLLIPSIKKASDARGI